MNTSFKKIKSNIFILLVFVNVSYGCGNCKAEEEDGRKLSILLAILGEDKKNQLRLVNEPNNTIETATCLSLTKELVPSYLYPQDDIDYYHLSILEVPLKLFIADLSSLSNIFNHGFQIYDETGLLIYDANNREFDKTSTTLVVNRNLRQDECTVNKCQDLTNIRYIEFSSLVKRIFIKIYSLKQEKYSEGNQLNDLIQLSSMRDPRENLSYPNILIQANMKACQ